MSVDQYKKEVAKAYIVLKGGKEKNDETKAEIKAHCKKKLMHYSVPYISSKFREELGCTAVQYLQRLRIEKSCKLLAASQQSIRQIAEAVGYENEKFFHKLFRRLMGMSPGAYRLRIRQADP